MNKQQFDAIFDDHFHHIFDVFNQGLFYLDTEDRMSFQNPEFYKMFDLDLDNTSLDHWIALVHPDDQATFKQEVKDHIDVDKRRAVKQYRIRNRLGEYIWIEGTGVIVDSDKGRYMVGSHKNITETKKMENYINEAAYRDSATGLSNRHKLQVDINTALEDSQNQYALIYIQIENLRSYINQFGSSILDDVLYQVIHSFDALSQDNGTFYRVRTDDFAILLRGEYSDESLAAICYQLINYYRESSAELGHMYGNEMSIGVYPFSNDTTSATDIIHIASRTCEYAKEKNDNNLEVFNANVQQSIDRFFYIEQQLKQALTTGEVHAKFQPIICAKTNTVSSFESLARWRSEQYGEIYPDEFIPVAEKKGLIIDLGYVIFEEACKFIKQYNDLHQSEVKVNVNVSVLQLLNPNFPGNIKMIADTEQLAPSQIVIELTETVILDDNPHGKKQLEKLASFGFNLSLDDFGAGHSSLNTFFELPLNQIKIDKSMAWKAEKQETPREYIEFLIKMCNARGVYVVIEGIETAEMFHIFEELGANFLQGYWFSKPLSKASASSYTL
ncbi:EAL domain-containing protein [Vibrio maerlii]|uniref:sensor domain-containing protein n=1 Tax=Vibrio maerlii TaxID=2231648 RepID=UPI000E3BE5B7|nr:EAL domain-containing protein [Vibrio maerlii]